MFDFINGLMDSSGARRMGMQMAGLSSGQIDAVESLVERFPAVKDLNMRQLLSDPNNTDLKQDVLRMIENPRLAEAFGQQLQADPSLVHRLNHLIANDPQKLRELLPEFERTPDRLGAILNQAVTPVQAQQAQAATEQAARNPLAGLGNLDFRQMFSGLGESFSMENIGKILLAVVNGIYGLVEGLVGGLARFAQSDEVLVAGNGGNTGPAASALNMTAGRDGPVMTNEGPDGTLTAMLQPGQEPAPAVPQTQVTENQPAVPQRAIT